MRTLALLSLLFTCALGKAQVNLVRNPSFEDSLGCPTSADQITIAKYWSGIDSVGVNSCIPEYCHDCSSFTGVPGSPYYYQYPRTGSAMAQVQTFALTTNSSDPFQRDYLQGRLTSPLIQGKTYCVAFYVVCEESSRFEIDKIGAYLDDGSIDTTDSCGTPLVNYMPQIQNNLGMLTDTLNWVRIEGTYTATGGEKFITIGNFSSFINSNGILSPDNPYNINNDYFSWHLIDDVSVIASTDSAKAGDDQWMVAGDSVLIGRTREIGLECKWFREGIQIGEGAEIQVKPTVTTDYVVEQTLCGQITKDTVRVEVWPTSINGLTNSRQLSIYPSPATTEVVIRIEKMTFDKVSIINNLGMQVSEQALNGLETHVDIQALSSGMYYLRLEGSKGREVRSFMKL